MTVSVEPMVAGAGAIAEMVKSPTWTVIVADAMVEPLVPVIVTAYTPAVLDVKVHMEVVLVVVAVRDTGFGLQPTSVTPLGLDKAVRVMLPMNPLLVLTVTVEVPDAPRLKLTGLVAVRLNDVGVQVNVATAEWVAVPKPVAAVPVIET